MRLPGLAGDDAAIANGLLVYKRSTGQLCVEPDVFVAGDTFALGDAGSRENLNAVADGEDPLLLRVEFADDLEEAPVVAEVLWRAAAEDEDGVEVSHVDLVDCEVGGKTVAGAFDVGIPAWLKVVQDKVEASHGWSGDDGAPVCFLKTVNRVKGFVGFACISGDDKYLSHKWWQV